MQRITLCLCVVLFGFTLPVSAQELNHTELLLEDWRRHLPDAQFEVLLVGEQEVPLVVHESSAPLTKGVAVIIDDAFQGPFHAQGLSLLVDQLTRLGWVTMQVPAPTLGFESFVKSEQTDIAQVPSYFAPPALNQEQFVRHATQLSNQMQSVASRADQYPGFLLVISQGSTAAWLTHLYADNSLRTPDALIMMAPFLPNHTLNSEFPEKLARTPMPVLDLYSRWDNGWSLQHVEERKVEAVRELKMHYRQREITGQPLDPEQLARVAKEIQGWLVHLGW